jgi:hypothetical protein
MCGGSFRASGPRLFSRQFYRRIELRAKPLAMARLDLIDQRTVGGALAGAMRY